jgi:signal transduction histidine kinase
MSAAPLVQSVSVTLTRARRLLAIIQWALPLSLSLLSNVYEFMEHQILKGQPFSSSLSMEVLLFGIIGPSIVAAVIFYIRSLLVEQARIQTELVELNRQLEQKIQERTIALEQRNRELAGANVELHKLDELKSEFVALVSHELRAPLTTLNGALEVSLQAENTMPSSARATLRIMSTESKRLTEFVQTILDLSRIEAGKLIINPGPVAIRPLLEQAASVVLVQSERVIEWNICGDLPPVWADEVLLEQVVRNLLSNADKYSPPRTRITIGVCALDEHNIRISVRDHGAGITPQLREHLFERFVRGQTGESAPPGWGLGLYLGRKLIEAQNGTIGVESPAWPSRDAPGSNFYLVLPIADTPEDI